MNHIVRCGDSIFDNSNYVHGERGEEPVLNQLQARIPSDCHFLVSLCLSGSSIEYRLGHLHVHFGERGPPDGSPPVSRRPAGFVSEGRSSRSWPPTTRGSAVAFSSAMSRPSSSRTASA